MDLPFDLAVIGAGVVGAAVARELSQYELKVALIEAKTDVGAVTSKANTAILHTGFDAPLGSLESSLLRRSYPRMVEYCESTGISLEKVGACLVAFSSQELEKLSEIQNKAEKNGVRITSLRTDEIYAREPNLGAGALGGLFVEDESIICPFSPPIAFASDAVLNGTTLFLSSPVRRVEATESFYDLTTPHGTIRALWVINVAGLFSDDINRHFGFTPFSVTPRKGELIVFDKLASALLRHIILPVPTGRTKGVLVSPTVYGNVLLGPTAEDVTSKEDLSTTTSGFRTLIEKGRQILPALLDEEIVTTYSGLRAATEHTDYQIFCDPTRRYVCVGAIRSTGLSASLGIADYVIELLQSHGVLFQKKSSWISSKFRPLGRTAPRSCEDENLIQKRASYGEIVCHCERVSYGEIDDAFSSTIPARTLDGLKRRTRCLQGRCQGFYCFGEIKRLLDERQ